MGGFLLQDNSVFLPQDYYFEFPWLNGSERVLLEILGVNQGDLDVITALKLIFSRYPEVSEHIRKILEAVANNREEMPVPTNSVINLAMYPVLHILLSLLGNRMLGNGVSNLFSKHFYNKQLDFFKNIKLRHSASRFLQFLQSILLNLGFSCDLDFSNRIGNNLYPFSMNYVHYLRIAPKLKDERWKLINQQFKAGIIYLSPNDVSVLIREIIAYKTRPDFTPLPEEIIEKLREIPQMAELEDYVSKLLIERSKRFSFADFSGNERIGEEFFPPCIRAILAKLSQGINLSHNERLALAFYYLNTNHSIEETVDLFRVSPDFDENIARYQVEFAAGLRGGGTRYSMFSCKKMKSLHMCYANHPKFGEELCIKGGRKSDGTFMPIKNPAGDYIFWKKVQLNRLHRSQVKIGETIIEKEFLDEDGEKDEGKYKRSGRSK